MFEIIKFDDGEFGILNQRTKKILAWHGEVISYPTQKAAEKRARKIAKNFNRALRRQQKKERS